MIEALLELLWPVLTVSLHDLWSWWIHAPVWISVPLVVVPVLILFVVSVVYQD